MASLIQVENLKMVAAGSSLLQNAVSNEALELSGRQKPQVLIVGTPKPTVEEFSEFVTSATDHFEALGAFVVNLHNFEKSPAEEEVTDKIENADVIWVAGGDTLKMMDFWRKHGVDTAIGKVASRGVVLSGGRAGLLA